MGTEKTRELKVQWLKDVLFDFFTKNPNGVVSRSKLQANFALEHNSTDRTAREILKTLEASNYIEMKGDDILWKKKKALK